MSRRTRRVVALVALCVAASMALGVGSYSSASAERSVSVSVVDDDEAYLSFAEEDELQCGPGKSAGNGGGQPFLYNRFTSDIDDIEVQITAIGGYVRVRANEPPKGQAKWLTPHESTTTFNFDDTYRPGSNITLEIFGPKGIGTKDGAHKLRIEVVEATSPEVQVTNASQEYTINCPDQMHPDTSSNGGDGTDSESNDSGKDGDGGNGSNGSNGNNGGNGNNGSNGSNGNNGGNGSNGSNGSNGDSSGE
jgi:hypothetical protein